MERRTSLSPVPTPQAGAGVEGGVLPGSNLNERTYQEVEYLKKNLGPILVAALAEICIRRPADPIEYLGHWLLRWRYNEELKRRDVQNALEVVRNKAWTADDNQITLPNPNAPSVPPVPEQFTDGFIPTSPYGPPGFGGPLTQEQLNQEDPRASVMPADDVPSADPLAELEGEGQEELKRVSGSFKAPSLPGQESRRSSQVEGEVKRNSLEVKRNSVGEEQPKRTSLVSGPPGLTEDRRPSQDPPPALETKRPSMESKRGSIESKRGSIESKRGSLESKRGSLESKRGSMESKRGSDAKPAPEMPKSSLAPSVPPEED